jgi:hypothetical protein
MLMQGFDTRCTECQQGTLLLIGRPGRVLRYEGLEMTVPRDFLIPTCDHCGAERIDSQTAQSLASAHSKARRDLWAEETQEMDVLVK